MKLLLSFLLVALAVTHGFKLNGNLYMTAEKPQIVDNMKNALKSKVAKAIPAVLGTALILGNPADTFAASSGGRSGGSSFRSAPRSYSAPRSSTRLGAGSYGGSVMAAPRVMPIMPISPFGYGYGGGFGFGLSPFSFIPINFNFILFAGLAYLAFNALQNRIGGADFSNDGDVGSLGGGATVMKVQVALDSDWSQAGNIMDTMSNLAAKKGAVTGRTEISSLLSEASLALLRKKSAWSAAAIEGERFNGAMKAEPFFQSMAVQERAKFETESNGSRESGYATIQPSDTGLSKPTQAVVSLVIAVRGRSDALRQLRNSNDVSACLQTLASEALTDDGENIMAVEVLWTPSENGNTLSERDLIMDYPELIRL
mmetsp:Transcript_26656/g.44983  ORF Transcript_26656/g.44983 Transcript_26656/m.44983 type:complete len:370 (+) Transcript_26656:151-1260(+)